MPDFKGRKDFPEVADDKIKIGDYSGASRMSVVDIYTPKEEPGLLDKVMATVKGPAANEYDSRILSQQPVIVLSDMEEEVSLINRIDGYLDKQEVDKSFMPFPEGHPMNPGTSTLPKFLQIGKPKTPTVETGKSAAPNSGPKRPIDRDK